MPALPAAGFDVVDHDGRVLLHTADLAAAVIAAASGAGRWLVAPDRWATSLTVDGNGEWLLAGGDEVPEAAIRRVLALIDTNGEPT